MLSRASQEACDRRGFLRRLGRGAVVMLLGLVGTAGAAGKAAAQQPAIKSEGCCQACCPDDCC